ncbi:MAG: hypothetical protein DWQ07_12670 [Chloroflexi bacterium]|nr:MAG: hypothetical protein DWQ07_12670 [Chloroflexota bacterium]MBL1196892.1 hypothetical protein [Chloroflexota bacterium]NOH14188.1 hypothetical protein [Chloroflexota bacterium]
MTSLDEIYPKPHLRVYDLDGRPLVLTIKSVTQIPIWDKKAGRKMPKWVIYFQEHKKYLIAKEILLNAVADIAGSRQLKDWIGTRVELYEVQDESFGDVWDVIRLRAPQQIQEGNEGDAAEERRARQRKPRNWPAEVVKGIVAENLAASELEAVKALNLSDLTIKNAAQFAMRWMAYVSRLMEEKELDLELAAEKANSKLQGLMSNGSSNKK